MIDKEIDYKGLITANKFEGIDSNITDIVKDFQIEFNGNKNSIKALINSAYLAGEFVSKDFKNGDFNLSSKKDISFQTAKIGFNLSAPIDFNNTLPLNAKLNINSNIVDISSDIIYNKEIKVDSLVTTPKKSILRDIDKNLNLDMITPLNVNVVVANDISLNLSSKGIKGNLKLNKESKDINGNLDLVGFNLGFTGNIDKKIVLNNNIKSIEKLIKKLQSIYKFEAPNIDGDAKIELVLKNKKDIKLNLTSDEINFKVDRNTEHILNKTSISLGFSDGILELSKYQTIFQKQKIFATKPSVIKFESPLVTISPLWINDELKVTGVYDIKEKNGDILAYANPLSISHEVIKLKTLIDIKTKLKGGDINVRGDITILNGRLFLNMDRKSFSSSSDIIIVQNQKPKESEEQKNLDLLLNLHTKKALVYKSKDANIKIKPNMVIQKSNGSPLQILGSVEIVDGSYYKFQNKKFVVKKSIVAFTGNPKNPLLDISAIYNSINYEITIHITGDPQIPNIMFSSIPRLTREQILSVILFDNESAGDSSSADDMMKMMGGAMAKSALSGIGVKIDHLSLGSDGTMEVGKKISDKVTIIYVNDEVSSARLEYDWTKNIKASITSDGESSGADIVFRREF
jgi:translocation and assembly module TamB